MISFTKNITKKSNRKNKDKDSNSVKQYNRIKIIKSSNKKLDEILHLDNILNIVQIDYFKPELDYLTKLGIITS